MPFPDINIPETEKNLKWGKSFIDAAIEYHQSSSGVRKSYLDDMFNSYNGIVKEATKKILTEKYGKSVSTQYLDFKLGYSKIKLLVGEFIDIEFNPTVTSINPERLGERIDFANELTGAMELKEYLKAVKVKHGISGTTVDIPDKDDPNLKEKLFPKTQNEIVMQLIIDDVVNKSMLKLKALESFKNLIIVSECHGIIERDKNQMDTLRIIEPDNAVFQENTNDPFCLDSPFKGERRWMYLKDILSKWKLSATDKKKLTDAGNTFTSSSDIKGFKTINGIPACEVYTIQWKTNRPTYTKVSPSKNGEPYRLNIEAEDYEKNYKKYSSEVEKGKYEIETEYKEDLWTITRIMQDVYVDFHRVPNQIQKLNPNNKYCADYDYVNFLFGTIDGVRVSLEAIISNINEAYNTVMHMILRELKKMKGKVFTYDQALKPKGMNMKSVFFEITEHGAIQFNSSPEGNYSQRDVTNATDFIKELDLGLSQSFNLLLAVKQDLEQTADRITGINETREGYAKASQTATGTQSNIEASRSITKELFYGHQMFMNYVFTNIAEKTKINREYRNSNRFKILMGKQNIQFVEMTEDLELDDFDIKLSDGKLENEIRAKASRYFDAEINAGNLSTRDVIKFDMTKNINEALNVLDSAWERIDKVRQEDNKMKSEIEQQKNETAIKLAKEDREDVQAHEVLLEQMNLDSKERIAAGQLDQKNMAENTKASVEKNKI